MKTLTLLVTLCIATLGYNQGADHSIWNSILQKHVTASGKVDYKAIKANPGQFNTYLEHLKSTAPSSSWTSADKKVYWINAYNAFTVKMIIDHYPLKSITSIKYGDKSAWDHKWITIGDEKLSLNDIEHKKLRPVYKDPRIHFAINCASYSCPILLNQAFTTKNVETLLTKQTKRFLADNSRNKITASDLQISELFKWYKEDFGDLRAFINKYSSVEVKSDAKISYLTYNWNLNE